MNISWNVTTFQIRECILLNSFFCENSNIYFWNLWTIIEMLNTNWKCEQFLNSDFFKEILFFFLWMRTFFEQKFVNLIIFQFFLKFQTFFKTMICFEIWSFFFISEFFLTIQTFVQNTNKKWNSEYFLKKQTVFENSEQI